MKRLTRMAAVGISAAGLLAAASTAGAAGNKRSEATAGAYPDAVYMKDTVKSVDMDTHQITMATSGKTMKVADDCKVMMHGKQGSMSDLKEGEQVRAAIAGKGADARVVEIWVIRPGGATTGTGTSAK